MIHLVELTEDVFALGAREAEAVVGDRNEDAARGLARVQRDLLFFASVLHRVVDEIGDDQRERVAIGGDVREIIGNVVGEVTARRVELRAHGVHGLRDHIGRRSGREVDGVLVAFQPREGEEIVRQPAEAQVFVGDEIEVFRDLLLVGVAPFAQRIDEHAHGGERRAQLVRDGGDRGALQLIEPELAIDREARAGGDDADAHGDDARGPRVGADLLTHGIVHRALIHEIEPHLPRPAQRAQRGLRDERTGRLRIKQQSPSRGIDEPHADLAGEDVAVKLGDVGGVRWLRSRSEMSLERGLRIEERLLVHAARALERRGVRAVDRIDHEAEHQHERDERHEHEQQQKRAELLGFDLMNAHGDVCAE